MAFALIIEFTGALDPGIYDAVNGKLGIDPRTGEGDWPPGLLSHAGGTTENGFAVLEVWDTKEQQEAFMRDRLADALQAGGAPMPDRMEWVDLLAYRTPGR
jgi:hypothetical protein